MKKNRKKENKNSAWLIILIVIGAIILDFFAGSDSSIGLSISMLIVIVLLIGVIIAFITNKSK